MNTSRISDPHLVSLLEKQSSQTPNDDYLFYKKNETYHPLTYSDTWKMVELASSRLLQFNIQKGDRICVIASTSPEWEIINYAILLIGCVTVGIANSSSKDSVQSIVNDCGASLVVYETRSDSDLSKSFRLPSATLRSLIPDLGQGQGLQDRVNRPLLSSDDPATIIYTSGTTGLPKGILYTHEQLLLGARAILNAFPAPRGSNLICWLPLAHMYQRIMNLYGLLLGAKIFFVRDPKFIINECKCVHPYLFSAVPSFYNQIYDEFLKELSMERATSQSIMRKYLSISSYKHFNTHRVAKLLKNTPLTLLKKYRNLLGTKLEYPLTGSAPTPSATLAFFHALGIPLYEGYAMSENTIPISISNPQNYKMETVGRPVVDNHFKISKDGEILVKGRGIFRGYYNDLNSDRFFTSDNYFKTNDLGYLDSQKFLRLTGRKSDIIKTSTGRKIAPTKIEALVQDHPDISHCLVHGNNQKFLIGLIAYGKVSYPPQKDLFQYAEERLTNHIHEINQKLSKQEQVWIWGIIYGSFSIQRKEITPTLKLRRNSIIDNYKQLVSELYQIEMKITEEVSPHFLHHRPS
ncbi:MAG: AMP-binding protein [Verrucomicrobiota bacterium]